MDSGRLRRVTAEDTSNSEEEDDTGSTTDSKDDGHNNDCGDGLSTPHSNIRPTFSRSQTPREGVCYKGFFLLFVYLFVVIEPSIAVACVFYSREFMFICCGPPPGVRGDF